jgi:hypothetical protein
MHLLWLFFGWPQGAVWGNVWAIPLCAVIGTIGAFIFRDHIGRALKGWWQRHLGHGTELAEIRALAAKAHQIAADTHKALTGEDHPDAPDGAM